MFKTVERLFEARLKHGFAPWCFSCTMRFHLRTNLHHKKLSNEVLLVGLMTFWVQREAGELPCGDSLIESFTSIFGGDACHPHRTGAHIGSFFRCFLVQPLNGSIFAPKENGCKFKHILSDVLWWSGPNYCGLAWLEDFWRYFISPVNGSLGYFFFRCLVSRVSLDCHPQPTESTKRLAGFRRSCSYHRTGPIYGTAYEARGSSFTLLHFVALKKTGGTQHWWDWFVGSFVGQQWMLMELACDPVGFPPTCQLALSISPSTNLPLVLVYFSQVLLRFSDWWLLDCSSLHYCLCFGCLRCVSRKIVVQALSTTFHWPASLYRAYLVGAETRSAGMSTVSESRFSATDGGTMAEPRYFRFLPSILGWSYWQRRWYLNTSLRVICGFDGLSTLENICKICKLASI